MINRQPQDAGVFRRDSQRRRATTGRSWAVLMSTVLISACASGFKQTPCHNAATPPSPTPAVEARSQGSLLGYYHWLRTISEQEQLEQYEIVRAGHTADTVYRDKLRLALLLYLPDTPFRDRQGAKQLAKEFLRTPVAHDAEDEALAKLLLDVLQEHERVRHKSRDAQQRLKKERELRKTLETQLEQLKAIEQDIIESEQSINVPAPATTNERETENPPGR